MCKVYNSIGCLTVIKTHLRENNVNDFNSLNEVLDFQNNFSSYRQKVFSRHEILIEQEKAALSADISRLETSIKEDKLHHETSLRSEIEVLQETLNNLKTCPTSNFVLKAINSAKLWYQKKKIQALEDNFNSKVEDLTRTSVELHQQKSNRYKFITTRFADAVNESCAHELRELERKQRVVDEVKTSIYGALGEHKVVKELESLPDEYILINDFSLTFHPAIYNRQEDDYIKTIQIDHILISPSGIFLIETKNWSEKSLNSLDLRSPVQQVKRTNFSLFRLLSGDIANRTVRLNKHHWGDRKIPIKNLIVLTNTKPNEEFQYVKVLTLSELLGYIRYFKPMFTQTETEAIANYLMNLNDEKHIATKY